MIPMPPRSTRNYTLVPYSTLFLSQITHQRPEDRVLAVEIGIESPQRDARAARDRADRAVVETLLAELRRRRIEQRAQRAATALGPRRLRSEEHTSDLQSLMRISYAVFCLQKKHTITTPTQ